MKMTPIHRGYAWLESRQWRLPADRWIFLALVCVSFFVRFPYLFMSSETRLWRYEMLYHDEALFLMQGRDVLNGYLPYIQHWDNRPPLGWALFAILNFLSGENLLAFRCNGAIYISITAFVLYRLFKAHAMAATGFAAGIFYVIFCSVAQVGQSITYEHAVGLPFALMLYALLCGHAFRRQRLMVATMFTVCCMTLTNFLLFFPAVALLFPQRNGLCPTLPLWQGASRRMEWLCGVRGWLYAMLRNTLYVAGALAVGYGLLYLLYWVNGKHDFLIRSMVDGAFTVSRQPMDERFITQMPMRWQGFSNRFFYSYAYSPEWLIPLLLGFFLTRAVGAMLEPAHKRDALAVKLMILLICSSLALFVRGGNFWNFPYYLLQVMPVVVLAMARAFTLRMGDLRVVMVIIVCVGIADATERVLSRYEPLLAYFAGDKTKSEAFLNDRLYQIAREINKFPVEGEPMIVCTEDDSLYVLTHTENPRYFIFPAFNQYNFLARVLGVWHEPLYELAKRSKPVAIVGWRGDKCFSMIGSYLYENYEMYSSIQNTNIYIRKDLLLRSRGSF